MTEMSETLKYGPPGLKNMGELPIRVDQVPTKIDNLLENLVFDKGKNALSLKYRNEKD